eukprot:5402733-Pleurochrysis_carterae.AAC.3
MLLRNEDRDRALDLGYISFLRPWPSHFFQSLSPLGGCISYIFKDARPGSFGTLWSWSCPYLTLASIFFRLSVPGGTLSAAKTEGCKDEGLGHTIREIATHISYLNTLCDQLVNSNFGDTAYRDTVCLAEVACPLCATRCEPSKRLDVPSDVAAFLRSLVPEHGVLNFDLTPLAGDIEVHPGPFGGLTAVADALREAHSLAPSPPPPAAPSAASFRAVATDLYRLTLSLTELIPPVPARAVRSVDPLPLSSALAYGLQPTLAPPPPWPDHLLQFAEGHVSEATSHMHEQLDGCLAALHYLGGQPGHGQERRGGVATVLGASHRALGARHHAAQAQIGCGSQACVGLPCSQASSESAPETGKGDDQGRHLRRAVDGLRQQFVALQLHGHEALLSPRRKFPMSHNLFHRLIASTALPEAPLFRASFLATMCGLYVSGLRKAELVVYLPERATWLTRASLLWVIWGVSTKHTTPQQLQTFSVGNRCEISQRQSKFDATGEVWGDRPIALAYVPMCRITRLRRALTSSWPFLSTRVCVSRFPSLRLTTPTSSRLHKPTASLPPCYLTACPLRRPHATVGTPFAWSCRS